MGGVLGGLIGIIDRVGGYILYCIVGKNAWNEGGRARQMRLNAAAIPTGALGGLIYRLSQESASNRLIVFDAVLGVLIAVAIVWILDWIDDQLT